MSQLPSVRFVILAIAAFSIAGCNEKATPRLRGPALDLSKAEILGFRLGDKYADVKRPLETIAKSSSRLLELTRKDASGSDYIWAAGSAPMLPGKVELTPDALIFIMAPQALDNTLLAIVRELKFGKEKPSSSQLLTSLVEKYGTPTDGFLNKEEDPFEEVKKINSSSFFFWTTNNDPKLFCWASDPSILYLDPRWENFEDINGKSRRRSKDADEKDVFESFSTLSKDDKECGTMIAARIRTSDVRDAASSMDLYLVDFLKVSEVTGKDIAAGDLMIMQKTKERESEPRSKVPPL